MATCSSLLQTGMMSLIWCSAGYGCPPPPQKGSSSGLLENLESLVEPLPHQPEYEILWKVENEGYYIGNVMYDGQAVGVANFEVICLNG